MAKSKQDTAQQDFDIFLGVTPNQTSDTHVFALVKMTFSYKEQDRVQLVEPIPLYNNFFDPDEDPRIKAGTDFWPIKQGTDIALKGLAIPLGGKAATSTTTSLQVGKYQKTIAVFGKRTVSCKEAGRVHFSRPEPFEQMELTYNNAYGGIDWRVPVEEPLTMGIKMRLQTDHPGLCPRNHFGKGYVILPDPEDIDGIELPNLENPADLLTEERLIIGDPKAWHKQPLPWCFDWTPINFFHRCAFFGGADGWYPAPEDSVTEVRLGLLPKNYRSKFHKEFMDTMEFDARFFSEASTGLAVPFLQGDEPVILQGVDPDGDNTFNLPGRPKIELFIEGEKVANTPALLSLLFLTEEKKFSIVWGISATSPRPFIPGIHKKIPLACRVNDGPPVHFEAPPPVEQTIKDLLAKQTKEG
ncbi:MAG: DUF2169 domain-containing protein [Desulfobacterales bacterium]